MSIPGIFQNNPILLKYAAAPPEHSEILLQLGVRALKKYTSSIGGSPYSEKLSKLLEALGQIGDPISNITIIVSSELIVMVLSKLLSKEFPSLTLKVLTFEQLTAKSDAADMLILYDSPPSQESQLVVKQFVELHVAYLAVFAEDVDAPLAKYVKPSKSSTLTPAHEELLSQGHDVVETSELITLEARVDSELPERPVSQEKKSKDKSTTLDREKAPECFPSVIPKAFSPDLSESNDFYVYGLRMKQEMHHEVNHELEPDAGFPWDHEAGFAVLLKVDVDVDDDCFLAYMKLSKDENPTSEFWVDKFGKVTLTDHELRGIKGIQSVFFETTLRVGAGQLKMPLGDIRKTYLLLPIKYYYEDNELVRWDFDTLLIYQILTQTSNERVVGFMNSLSGKDSAKTPMEWCEEILAEYSGGNWIPQETSIEYQRHVMDTVLKNVVMRTSYNKAYYYGKWIDHDRTPNSSFPNPKIKSYKAYYSSKHGLDVQFPTQPLIRATMEKFSNYLVDIQVDDMEPEKSSPKEQGTFLIPEFCTVSPLSRRHIRIGRMIPSLLHRFEGLVLMEELRDRISIPRNVRSITLLEALTASSCNDQFSYEKLETLGDSFLKFAVSCDLYPKVELENEGALTRYRSRAVQNKNLHRVGVFLRVPEYMQTRSFHQKHWYCPGAEPFLLMDPKKREIVEKDGFDGVVRFDGVDHWIAHKGIADVIEAVIGAHIRDGGQQLAFDFLKQCELITNTPGSWKRWAEKHGWMELNQSLSQNMTPACVDLKQDYTNNPKGAICELVTKVNRTRPVTEFNYLGVVDSLPVFSAEARIQIEQGEFKGYGESGTKKAAERLAYIDICDQVFGSGVEILPSSVPTLSLTDDQTLHIQGVLGYSFTSPELLVQAFTHTSMGKTCSYERIEFLGDAVFDWIVTATIYTRWPRLSPGDVTHVRTLLVSNRTLGFMILWLGLQKHLKYQSDAIDEQIELLTKQYSGSNWDEFGNQGLIFTTEGPDFLGDIFEALVGSVFVDSGFDIRVPARIFAPFVKWIISRLESASSTLQIDLSDPTTPDIVIPTNLLGGSE